MKKVNLSDVTFLILVRIESIERIENLMATIDFLTKHFDTNITVWECSVYNNKLLGKLLSKKIHYKYIKDNDTILYRTHYLNQMTLEADTPILAIWDSDVISTVQQIVETVELLRTHTADIAFPYNRFFLDTSDIIRRLYLESRKNKSQVLLKNKDKMKEMYTPNPVGGAFFCDRAKYIESGMENERFYGWGIEDGERCARFHCLKLNVKRIEGPLFHLSHPRGINSNMQHPDQQLIKLRELAYSSNIKPVNHE